MSQLGKVMMIVVVVTVVMVMCIKRVQNWCWFHFLTHTPKTTKSWYVIVGLLLTLPTLLLTTLSTDYCLMKNINDFGLRRLFYSK